MVEGQVEQCFLVSLDMWCLKGAWLLPLTTERVGPQGSDDILDSHFESVVSQPVVHQGVGVSHALQVESVEFLHFQH